LPGAAFSFSGPSIYVPSAGVASLLELRLPSLQIVGVVKNLGSDLYERRRCDTAKYAGGPADA